MGWSSAARGDRPAIDDATSGPPSTGSGPGLPIPRMSLAVVDGDDDRPAGLGPVIHGVGEALQPPATDGLVDRGMDLGGLPDLDEDPLDLGEISLAQAGPLSLV